MATTKKSSIKRKEIPAKHAMENYILDFYCHEHKLAIELDGGIHNIKENQQYDAIRTDILNRYGINVIRFRNEEVLADVENVLGKIAEYLIP